MARGHVEEKDWEAVRQILYWGEFSEERIPQAHLPSSSDKNHHISSVWPRVICAEQLSLSLSLSSISSTSLSPAISCHLLMAMFI